MTKNNKLTPFLPGRNINLKSLSERSRLISLGTSIPRMRSGKSQRQCRKGRTSSRVFESLQGSRK